MKRLSFFLLAVVLLVGLGSCYRRTRTYPALTEAAVREAITVEDKSAIEWPPGLGELDVELEQDMLKKNYYLVFDGSASMRGRKIDIAKTAVREFVNQVPPDASLGLFVFDFAGVFERAPLGSSRTQIIEEIDKVVASRSTPLTSAVAHGYQMLSVQGVRQLGYGEYNMVVVTDGAADNPAALSRIVAEVLTDSPVVIHTIGYQIRGGHSLNQPGRIAYKSAENLEQLREGLQEVLAEAEDFVVGEFQDTE